MPKILHKLLCWHCALCFPVPIMLKIMSACILDKSLVITGGMCQRYNPRSMPSIWCTPQAPSCQSNIYTVLKAALREAD